MFVVIHRLDASDVNVPTDSALCFSPVGRPCQGQSPRPKTATQRDKPMPTIFPKQHPPLYEPLNAVVNVRLTTAEKARLQEDADLAGLTVSALVRRRYFGRPVVAQADMVMIKELRRLGGLLKHLHNESDGAHSQETMQTLSSIRSYIQGLSRGLQKD